jgi:hypothetical protein
MCKSPKCAMGERSEVTYNNSETNGNSGTFDHKDRNKRIQLARSLM